MMLMHALGFHGHLMAVNANLGHTKAAKTIKTLIKSAGTWIAGLGAVGGGTMIGYHALMRNLSGGDAQADAHHLQAIKKVAVGTAIVVGASGIAHFVGGLF
jgi:hypothetical protein